MTEVRTESPRSTCRLIVVEQCGHCIHLERPREIVDGLLDFIPELRGAPQAKRSSVTAPAT